MFAETTRRVAIPLHVNSERSDPKEGKKRVRVKGFLADCDFADTIREGSTSPEDSCSLLLPTLPATRDLFHEVVPGIRVTDRCAS